MAKAISAMSKSQALLMERNRLGKEEKPVPLPGDNAALYKALEWYNSCRETEHAREYIEDWLKSEGRDAELARFKKVPKDWVSLTCGWMARLTTRGMVRTPSQKSRMEGWLKDMLRHSEVDEAPVQPVKKVEVVRLVIHDIEQLLDQGTDTIDVEKMLRDYSVKPASCSAIVDKYQPQVDEIREAISKKAPEDLKEAYQVDKPEKLVYIRKRLAQLESVIEQASAFGEIARVVKKPIVRKPRTVSLEKKLKNFQYQSESAEYKVRSEDPAKIVGAQQVWVFDTKYREVTVFRAKNENGLDVKNSKVLEFDPERSFRYKTGRRTAKIVSDVVSLGKASVHKAVDKMKTTRIQERVRDRCLILRIFR